jgi:hypothetical protein
MLVYIAGNVLQSLQHGMRAAATRGLIAMFASQARKCPPARLGKGPFTLNASRRVTRHVKKILNGIVI